MTPRLEELINKVLEREWSAYRFLNGVVIPITNENELEEIQSVINDPLFTGAAEHIQSAVRLLADRNNPEPRNSIKESISAVESVARLVSQNTKANLVPFASMKMVTQVFKDERTVFRNSVDWFLEVLEPKMLSKILDGRIKSLETIQHYEKVLVELAAEEKNKERHRQMELEDREFDQYRDDLNPPKQWLPTQNIRE